jgi:hypothetical protein
MAKLTQSQVYAIALAAGLPDPKKMAAIAMQESSGDTNVVNSIGCVGLWQINQPVHVKSHPTWTVKWLQNPFNNAAAAKIILKTQGLGAWEAYTGPDGKGTDGPWRKYENERIDTNTTVDQASWIDPLDILPDGAEDKMRDKLGETIPGFGTVDAIGDALAATADVLVNPKTWLRVAYGVTGVLLIVGGLFLIVRNTPAGKATAGAVKKTADLAANYTPVGRAVNTAKAAAKATARPAKTVAKKTAATKTTTGGTA